MTVIPKNAQVVVRRVPASAGRRPAYLQPNSAPRPSVSHARPILHATLSTAPPAGANGGGARGGDEDSRIQAMMAASGSHWAQNQQEMPMQQLGPRKTFRPMNFAPRGSLSTPPDAYVCYRCGQKGHFIQNCPTNADPNYDRTRVRKTTGIPKSFLKPVAAGDSEAASNFLVTPEGTLVVAAPNDLEWNRLSTIKAFAQTATAIPLNEIPDQLKCLADPQAPHLLIGAVTLTCCGSSFCDDCIRKRLEETLVTATGDASLQCPHCGKQTTQDQVAPDEALRVKVTEFLESHNKFAISTPELEDLEEGETSDATSNQAPAAPPPPMHHSPPFGFPPMPFFFPPPIPGMPLMFPPMPLPFGRPPPPPRNYRRPEAPSGSRSRSRSRSRSPEKDRSRSDDHS